jgi:amino acid adenylation domain-containing protein
MNESSGSIPGRFARVVSQFPGRIAVSTPDAQWSYAELDERSDAVAGRILDRLGESPEPVTLLMEHGAPLIAAILGVLKSGKIYLVLDPTEPPARLQAMLDDAGTRLLLADATSAVLARSFKSDRRLQIETDAEPRLRPAARPTGEVSPDAGAWLMYTSGSTGAAKGVWQNHRGVVHHAEVYAGLIQLGPDDRMSLLTPCHLAASATALFTALLNGAAICPFHVRSQGTERLAAWLHEQRITVYHSVPTIFRQLLRTVRDDSFFETLRLVRLGGEAMFPTDVEAFQKRCPGGCRLMHALSSTETGLISAFIMGKNAAPAGPRIPVGQTVRGVEVVLLDDQYQPVQAATEGRIAVRSAHLAQGYWRQPGATAKAFRKESSHPHTRLFITGDLGQFRPDGCLEHLGREDQQVKIRGRRVDLMEVEAALKSTNLVANAAAAAHADARGELRLVGYIVPRNGTGVTPQSCRHALQSSAPAHLIPTDFVMLRNLPLTSGGKVDRRSLPPPKQTDPPAKPQATPSDTFEAKLLTIWQTVLGSGPGIIGRKDDFFDLGGDSLRAVQMLVQIEETFGVILPPEVLIEHSTIEKLASVIKDRTIVHTDNPLVELRAAPAGRPLFLIHNGKGAVLTYSQLVRRLPGRPIYGLQSRGLRGESWPLTRIPDMVRYYLPEVLAKDPTGPYLLAGSCMGAMVAFEMAQQLVRLGRTVGWLALIDSSAPPFSGRRSHFNEQFVDPVRDAVRILRWAIIRRMGRGRSPRSIRAYRHFVSGMNGRAWHAYRPQMYPGKVTLIQTAEPFAREDRRPLMAQYARESQTIVIPGNRSGLFAPPAVDELARQLQSSLDHIEGKNPS